MTEDSADPISSLRWVEAMLSPAAHGVWRSLVARFVRDEEVVGSNPATPTIESTLKPTSWKPHDVGFCLFFAGFWDRKAIIWQTVQA